MIGNFLSRGLVMIFGYMYPAYDCFKTLERNKPNIDQLRFWCQYWILVAVLTVFERLCDAFISWVPMYSEAKLAFIVYLWYPKTKGTTFVYDSFFKPYVAKHENEIDRTLLELKTRAGDMAYMYCQMAASYGQTRFFEVLQFVAAQSALWPRAAAATQPQEPATRTHQRAASSAAAISLATAKQPHDEVATSISSTSSSQDHDMEDEVSSSRVPSTSGKPPPSQVKKSVSMPNVADIESSAQSAATDKEDTTEDTVMEDTIRATRGRLRKTNSTVSK